MRKQAYYIIKDFSKTIENPKKNAEYIYPRIYRDKTIDKLINILNNDKQNYIFCRLQLVVETFELST